MSWVCNIVVCEHTHQKLCLINDITHRHVANILNGPDSAYIHAPKLLAPKIVFCAESQVPHCKISSLRSRSQTKMSRQYWPLASSPKRRTRRRRRPRLRMVSVSRRQKSDFHCCIHLMALAQTHLVCSDVALVGHCQRAQYRGPWLGTATVLTVQRIWKLASDILQFVARRHLCTLP